MSNIKEHFRPLMETVKSVNTELKVGHIYQALAKAFFNCKWESVTALRDAKHLEINNIAVIRVRLTELGLTEDLIDEVLTKRAPAIVTWMFEMAKPPEKIVVTAITESVGKNMQVIQRRRFAKLIKPEVK